MLGSISSAMTSTRVRPIRIALAVAALALVLCVAWLDAHGGAPFFGWVLLMGVPGAAHLFVATHDLGAITLPGTAFPLGFWFAQQGSIYVFVILIFVYVKLMNGLDEEFGVGEGDGE